MPISSRLRCSIVEGAYGGFLIEQFPGGEYIYQLATSCTTALSRKVWRKIRTGWVLKSHPPPTVVDYKNRVYFFVQYKVKRGIFRTIHFGHRKVGDWEDGIDKDTPNHAKAYDKPWGVWITPHLIEVRFRPEARDITFDQLGQPTIDLTIIMNACDMVPFQMGRKSHQLLGNSNDADETDEVEEDRDYKVEATPGFFIHRESGKKSLCLDVTNRDTTAIKDIKFSFDYGLKPRSQQSSHRE